jgi:hypothetical protein
VPSCLEGCRIRPLEGGQGKYGFDLGTGSCPPALEERKQQVLHPSGHVVLGLSGDPQSETQHTAHRDVLTGSHWARKV